MKAKQIDWTIRLEEFTNLSKTMTQKEMVEHFGVSIHAVKSALKRYDLKAKPDRISVIQSLNKDELREMRQTMSGRSMARELGVSFVKLCAHLKKHGITGPIISTRSSTGKKDSEPKPVDSPKKTAPKVAPATAKIIYPEGFKITRHVSEPCDDFRSPMKRENYDPKMHAASFGYSRL